MTLNKLFYLAVFVLIIHTTATAQAPAQFSYQAIARDASGTPIPNRNLSLEIRILQGSFQGSEVYREIHELRSNNFGLFDLKIGNGANTSGDLLAIDWGNGPYFLQVGIDPNAGNDFSLNSVTELVSVPYALYAEQTNELDGDPLNEIQDLSFDQATRILSLSASSQEVFIPDNTDPTPLGAGTGIIISNGTVSAEDPSPDNELQTLAWDDNSRALTISQGNTVTIPGGTGGITYTAGQGINIANGVISATDLDADPSNELQQLTFNAQSRVLTLSQGNEVFIPAGSGGSTLGAGQGISINNGLINADDPDPTNEFQTLSINGNTLVITNGNSVELPTGSGNTFTAGNGIDITNGVISSTDQDSDPANELQELSFDTQSRVLTLSQGNNVFIPAGSGGSTLGAGQGISINNGLIDADDPDPTNEIQSLELNGTTLSLTGANSVELPAGGGTLSAGPGINIANGVISTNDQDTDPTNEIQDITWNDQTRQLSISNGSTVTIPDETGSGSSVFQLNGNDAYYEAGEVSIGTQAVDPEATLTVGGNIFMYDNSDRERSSMGLNTADGAYMAIKNTAGNYVAGFIESNDRHGSFEVRDRDNSTLIWGSIGDGGAFNIRRMRIV